tara:strand:- start:457 stop:774 length:318 start_codon:yes stop_codon:yes gene_type:complete
MAFYGENACKAFAFFNDNASVIGGNNFNVSSVADNGSSDYSINFSSNMADGNYMPLVQCSQNDDGRCAISNEAYNSAGTCRFFTRSGFTSGRSDANNNMVTIWNK